MFGDLVHWQDPELLALGLKLELPKVIQAPAPRPPALTPIERALKALVGDPPDVTHAGSWAPPR